MKIAIILGILIVVAGIVLLALSQRLPTQADLLIPGIIIIAIGSVLISFGSIKK
jgi:uncharacterized membrane protein